MRHFNTIMILFVVLVGVSFDAVSRTYYVSSSGNDGSTGTLASPWRTLGRASSGLQPGDTVLVRGGVYHERVEITNSGTLAAPIVYRAYPGEKPEIDGAPGTNLNVMTVWGNFVVIEGFLFTNQNYYKAPGDRTYWVALEGNYLMFRYNHVVAYGDVYDNIYVRLAESRGVVVAGNHTIVEHCYVRGQVLGIVIAGPSPRYVIVRYDTVHATGQNNIDNMSTSNGDTAYHATLIERCQLDTSIIEDNIQFEVDYNDEKSTLHNRGTIVRYNVMGNAAENVIDLKGAGHTIIEHNLAYSSSGDDDGPVGGHDTRSGGGITSNPNNPTRNTIIRYNVIWDNCTGMEMAEGDHYFNNTILNNRRTWQGPNQTSDAHTAIRAWSYPQVKRAFLNNIVGAQPNIGVFHFLMDWGDKFHLNNNLYYDSSASPKFFHRMNGSTLTTQGVQNWKNALSSHGGYAYMQGKDAASREADPQFMNAPVYAYGYDPAWNFALKPTSPAIDGGTPVTVATNSGTSSTRLVVDDSYFFCDGFGITAGDMIMVGGGEPVQILAINYTTNVMTLSDARSWAAGAGVHIAFAGNAPDIGAYEYEDGVGVTTPPDAPQLVIPANNTTGVALTSFLNWAPAWNAISYQLQVSLTSGFGALSISVSGLTAPSFPLVTLAGRTTYYWRVRASGAAGTGPWSSIRQFTTSGDTSDVNKEQPSVLTNGGFESGTSDWTFYANSNATMQGTGVSNEGSSAVQISVQSAGTNIQLYQSGITLSADTYYKLSFSAYSNSGHDLAVGLMQHGSPYTNYGMFGRPVALGSNWKSYEVYIKTANFTGTVNDARLQFWFADYAEEGDLYVIDDVQLRPGIPSGLPGQAVCSTPGASDCRYLDSVTIHWPEIPRAESYQVQVAHDAAFTLFSYVEEVYDTMAVITVLGPSAKYYVRVRGHNIAGYGEYSPSVAFWTSSSRTGVDDVEGTPASFTLMQNYPNPFNPGTVIRYALPARSMVRLEVFNSIGQSIAVADEGERSAGMHEVAFAASNLPSGVYFYTIRAGAYVETKRMMLLK